MMSTSKSSINPPLISKKEKILELHGDRRVDPYYWLKNRDTPEVLAALNAERDYYLKSTTPLKSLSEKVFNEMKNRVKEDDSTAPYFFGSYWYYTRFESGKEYSIFCRKKEKLTNREEIILDVNELSKGKKYTSVSGVKVSKDEKIIAYAADFVGRRFYDIHFKNLTTGQVLKNSISQTTGNFVWANDNIHLFYTQQNPETLRSEKVFRYNIQTQEKTEIYFEKNEIFSVGVSKSLTQKYLFMGSGSFDSSEVYFLDADDPKGEWKVFLPREPNHEYDLEDGGDGFYIRTNWNAENFRIMKASHSSKTNKNSWTEILPQKKDAMISEFLVLKDHIVVSEESKAVSPLLVYNRKTKESTYLLFPDPVFVASLGSNMMYDTPTFRYAYQSLVSPPTIYDFSFSTRTSSTVRVEEVPTYNKELYQSERQWAKAKDGSLIPISIVYRKDKFKKRQNPILIYGYGSYGLSMDASFRRSIFSLLDRGFVYAIAHVRGGSEMGRYWYEQGRMNFKRNTFTDFIDSTEFLIDQGYGNREQIYAQGGSAGGLLMGAISNMRPDLYRGIVSQVPFVDVLTTMLDPDIPLTTAEYEQWGNPNEKSAYDYIKSYSPYDQITRQAYPHMLVVTGYHDSQVQYWEPAKYVAKLRDHTTSGNPILFKIDMDSGHSGASGRFKSLQDRADEFAYILNLAGVKD